MSSISAPSKYIEHKNIRTQLQTDTGKERSNKTINFVAFLNKIDSGLSIY